MTTGDTHRFAEEVAEEISAARSDAAASLRAAKVIGVLRAPSAAAAIALAGPAMRAGLKVVEVTFTVPDASQVIRELLRRHPDVTTGAGTVLTAEQAAAAVAAGAAFLVSPHYVAEVQRVARRHGVTYVPGALTPSEVHAAARAVNGMVKVFPVARMGASRYVRDLLGPYPDLELMVTGGVSLDDAAEYLDAGAKAVGIGSLFGLDDAALRKGLARI